MAVTPAVSTPCEGRGAHLGCSQGSPEPDVSSRSAGDEHPSRGAQTLSRKAQNQSEDGRGGGSAPTAVVGVLFTGFLGCRSQLHSDGFLPRVTAVSLVPEVGAG